MAMEKKGFTLIELLVVIAIIGILSGVVITSLNSARGKASDSSNIVSVKEVAKAMEISRNQSTGLFTGYSNAAAAGIGLQTYITPWLSDIVFIDNTGDTTTYCVYAPLTESAFGYFVANDKGAGYRSTIPNIAAGTADAS